MEHDGCTTWIGDGPRRGGVGVGEWGSQCGSAASKEKGVTWSKGPYSGLA